MKRAPHPGKGWRSKDTTVTTTRTSTDTAAQDEHRFSEEHVQILKARAIPPAYAWRLGSRTITEAQAKDHQKLLNAGGKDPYKGLPVPCAGLLIVYPDGEHYRLRVDRTEYPIPGECDGSRTHGQSEGTRPRYYAQPGAVVPYIMPEVMPIAADTSKPITICEAPLKAMALSANGWPAVGLGGVLAGAHDVEAKKSYETIAAHPYLKAKIDWRGRDALTAFDAGIATNPLVALGAAWLWEGLRKLGASVKLVRIPYYHPAQSDPEAGRIYSPTDQGPDDYIARHGREAYQRLVDEAVPFDLVVRIDEIKALTVSNDDKTSRMVALLDELPIQAALYVGGARYVEKVAVTCRRLLGKAALKQAAQDFATALQRGVEEPGGIDATGADELELAHLLIGRMGRVVYTEGAFHQYGAGIWSKQDAAAVRCVTHEFQGARLTDRKIKGVVSIAADVKSTPKFFGEATPGLAFADGLVTIHKTDGIQLLPHDPEHRARHAYPWSWEAETAPPTQFLGMLDRYFKGDADQAEKIAALQEHMGRGLFGLGAQPDSQAIVMIGEGDDGKSTLCSIYEALLPPGSCCHITPQDLGDQYARAQLAGKLVNICADISTREMLDTGSWKASITGDGMRARFPYEPPFDFVPVALQIASVNRDMPPVSDRTNGMRKRMLVLRFNHAIPKGEQNANIKEVILGEEKHAVVRWLVEGAQRSVTKLTVPPSSLAEVQRWFDNDDPIAHYTGSACHVFLHAVATVQNGFMVGGKWTSAESVYDHFAEWFKRHNPSGRIMSSTKFGDRLKRDHKVPSHRTERGVFYALVPSTQAPEHTDAAEILEAVGNVTPIDQARGRR
jgi:P4 family phage/plasmid primase-like protien